MEDLEKKEADVENFTAQLDAWCALRKENSDFLSSAFNASAISPGMVEGERMGVKDVSTVKDGATLKSFLSEVPGAGEALRFAHCFFTVLTKKGGHGMCH